MPNHVTTRCVVSGTQAEAQRFKDRAFVRLESHLQFDFNAFISMPEMLRTTISGTVSEEGAILISAGISILKSRFRLAWAPGLLQTQERACS